MTTTKQFSLRIWVEVSWLSIFRLILGFSSLFLKVCFLARRNFSNWRSSKHMSLVEWCCSTGQFRLLSATTAEFFATVRRRLRESKGMFVMHAESPLSSPRSFQQIAKTLSHAWPCVAFFHIFCADVCHSLVGGDSIRNSTTCGDITPCLASTPRRARHSRTKMLLTRKPFHHVDGLSVSRCTIGGSSHRLPNDRGRVEC